jgi:DNA ligase-1
MYAHRAEGHGYSQLTFGLIMDGDIVSVCKTLEGLSRKELDELFTWIKNNTLERIGPVRTVPPVHIFELSLERIEPSSRHKCGLAVHGPRITSWRRELTIDPLDMLK